MNSRERISSVLKKTTLWTLALLITLASAVYQRQTGPTYPLGGELDLDGVTAAYSLTRTHGGPGDQEVVVSAEDPSVTGTVTWRRYTSSDSWSTAPMVRRDDRLVAFLPHQPPAGKIEYSLTLNRGLTERAVPARGSVVTRFKGAVPGWALLPHIIFMFAAMLVSNFAGLEALRPTGKTRNVALISTLLLTLGGMIFGPIVQKFAFGEYWTGVPFGWDLTDNKTLIAFIFWVVAVWAGRGGRNARWWVFTAAVMMLVIFMVPHSMFGSEL
jgi:hypothetical protein